MCTMCFPGAHGGQKKASDPLKLDLQMVVSHCVSAGIEPGSFGRAAISPVLFLSNLHNRLEENSMQVRALRINELPGVLDSFKST